jgi:hypothetical protein
MNCIHRSYIKHSYFNPLQSESFLGNNAVFVEYLLPTVQTKGFLFSGHLLGEFFEQVIRG